ncbi:rod shape-determining protein [Escherichia coli]|uniref:Rod shape-determining protein n=1 Tax=Escherichia coli TaxID=562 RepID=A0A376TR04_ECOLX|nr:rod shape-determining protein [Escherichia coli]
MKPIFSRGPSLQIRLILAVLVALGIIIADSRLGRSVKSVLIWIPPSVLSTLFPMLLVNCWMAYRRRWPRVTN